ncbi:MAG: guanylate kinase [Candidatus Aminicenantes bacterium]|nr:guanylate kinase [Candidatus Aminicenantes bacterium]
MNYIIIISGPSGCGKSTLIRELLAEFPELNFSVSHTTRPPRKNEIPGKDYHFVTAGEFQKMLRGDQFVEWAEVHGHRYGTSWKEIRTKSGQGKTLVLDIDVQGARSIKRQFPEAMAIFVIPPTLAALKKRLRQRETRLNPEARKRLQAALSELRAYKLYDYVIINDKLATAQADLRSLYAAFGLRMSRNQDKIKKLLRGHK